MNEQVEQGFTQGWSRNWRDYYELCKPKVVGLIVFTAIVGMFLSSPGLPPIMAVLFGTLYWFGGGLRGGHQSDRRSKGRCRYASYQYPADTHGSPE